MEIITSVQQVADTISEISSASEEQAAGIDQVNKAVAMMDDVVQQNAALVEEAAAASQSLAMEAGELQALMSEFGGNSGNSLKTETIRSHREPKGKTRLASVTRLPRKNGGKNIATAAGAEGFVADHDEDFDQF
jgi:uncharacterized phage infection (PIP) family protein YhgE